jgi:hypothetical protein
VEGGWGDVSLSYLRNYGSPEGRIEVAERYLKEGKISAEEYLDITTDLNFSIWGIEDPDFYAENMNAFLRFSENQEKYLSRLSKIETGQAEFKKKIFPSSWMELETKKKGFEEKKIGLLDFLHFLNRQNGQTTDLPHLNKLLAASGLQGGVDPEKAEWEKSTLIRALAKKLTKPELGQIELLGKRKTPQDELAFLQSLLQFQAKYQKKISKVGVGHLERYTQALQELQQADPRDIFSELEQLEEITREKLLTTPEQKELAREVRALETLRKLFELKLGPKDFERIEKHPEDFKISNWSLFKVGAVREPPLLESAIPQARAFYLSAAKREKALIENIAGKMEETTESVAAVIVGGFHAEELTAALKAKGYSIVVVAPRFMPADSKTQQQHYFEILKYKWGAGPIAAANPNPKS